MTADSEDITTKKSKSPKGIIGSMFIISILLTFISLGIITIELFRRNFITGAIIGTRGITSYAVITLIFSSIITVFLSLIRIKK